MPTTFARTALEVGRVSAVHHKRLVAGYQHFSEWCAVRRINLQDVLADIPSISGLLAHFVQHCRDNQMAIHVARFAVLGVSLAHLVWMNLTEQQRSGLSEACTVSAHVWAHPPSKPLSVLLATFPVPWCRPSRTRRSLTLLGMPR